MKKKKRPYLLLLFLGFAFFVIGNRISVIWQTTNGNVLVNFNTAFSSRLVTSSPAFIFANMNFGSVLIGLGFVSVLILFYVYKYGLNKNYMDGIEHGSARFGEYAEAEPFFSKTKQNNIILSKDLRLALDNRELDYKYHTNKNILVLGSTGKGKTRFYVKPNILQNNACFVVTDPKGQLLPDVGGALEKQGYKIKHIYTIAEFLKYGMHYNPFHYMHSEASILQFITGLMANTDGQGKQAKEDFWIKAERLLLAALIGYVLHEATPEENNFDTLLKLFDGMEVKEKDEDYVSPVDILFDELAEEKPESFAVRQYRKFKQAAGETAKGILISVGARLSPFDIQELREMMMYDEMELDKIGFEKIALFIMSDDTDTTFNFLIGVFYTQLLSILVRNADRQDDGRLPIHTRLILDEFANIYIPNTDKIISQIRSREISMSVILQNAQQLKAIYGENGKIIEGNCDTTVFLGSDEQKSATAISEKMDKMTIDIKTYSESRGNRGSSTVNENILGRSLMTAGEVRALPTDECLVFISGLQPFRDKKYILENHPNYKLTGDYDPNLKYRIKKGEEEEEIFDIKDFLQDVTAITQVNFN